LDIVDVYLQILPLPVWLLAGSPFSMRDDTQLPVLQQGVI